jgi:transposase-like protein
MEEPQVVERREPPRGGLRRTTKTRYAVEVKLRAVRLVLEQGFKRAMGCQELGIGKNSLVSWIHQYRQQGEAGLRGAARGPRVIHILPTVMEVTIGTSYRNLFQFGGLLVRLQSAQNLTDLVLQEPFQLSVQPVLVPLGSHDLSRRGQLIADMMKIDGAGGAGALACAKLCLEGIHDPVRAISQNVHPSSRTQASAYSCLVPEQPRQFP